ncbi:MAG: membrane protein insertase YidC [Clostridiales bacterium]|nr:membrane protein insertase YidC [Clostridiales bacterium]
MSIGSILYQLLLSPLTLILEAVFAAAFYVLGSCGAAIFPLSLVVNLLLLPFYNRADAIQAEERDREKKMEPFVSHIKKSFKGDERYMMLQAFYKENNYKPIYALRSSIALILEVPFFIAAYNFLSNLPALRGTGFLFLKDLGQPDALFKISGFSINVLPILMTLINVVSSEIYTKGLKFKDKITLHGMALIFLVLLYNSPSGLVLYWTLNNVFSLIKNIVNARSDKRRATGIAFSVTGLLIIIFGLLFKGPSKSKMIILLVGAAFQLPLLLRSSGAKKSSVGKDPSDNKLFIYGALFLSIFLGALIPSFVIASSPSEFVLMTAVHSPVRYIIYSLLTAVGAFVIWGSLFYYLAGNKNRKRATAAIWCFSIIGTVNFLLFGKSESILSSDLQFDTGLSHAASVKLLNLFVTLAIIGAVIFLFKKSTAVIRFIASILLIVATAISGYNIYKISSDMPDIRRVIENTNQELPEIPLSRDGQNVVVIMVDRAIASYIPYMFQERPELKEQFSGFTWYPNTLSFGMRTVIAAPALFGGYDYTPDAINDRTGVPLQQKHDESLLTMPILFSEAGYDVTVFDPPFAGYSAIPDLSIYDKYPSISAYNTELGLFRDSDETDSEIKSVWKRNFFCYSLMKASPMVLQSVIYTDGTYFAPDNSKLSMQTLGEDTAHYIISAAYMNLFRDSYAALQALPSMTKIDESSDKHFFLLQNGTAHNVMPLQEPDYAPQYEVDNTEFDKTHTDRFTYNGRTMDMAGKTKYKLTHYQCNMAAWIQLGNWMDYLKELGVYDNTRIVIVSDHGWPLGNFEDMLFLDGSNTGAEYNPEDAMAYNPVLFVKDFGAKGEIKTDNTFMTNADTPYLAMNGLIDDPVNPFTGNPMFRPEEKEKPMYIMYTDKWGLTDNSGTTFTDTIWYSLNGPDIFNKDYWKQEESEP